MTQREILVMAKQVGIRGTVIDFHKKELEAFAKQVAEKEREACLKIVGDKAWYYPTPTWATAIANAIRARGQA
jgi:hypothetical protein